MPTRQLATGMRRLTPLSHSLFSEGVKMLVQTSSGTGWWLHPLANGHLFHQRNRAASLACIWRYLCLEREDQTGTSAAC